MSASKKRRTTPMRRPRTVAGRRSGQPDWIEAPAPDAVPSLKSAGFKISAWPYPHTYPYVLNVEKGSLFAAVRIHRAMNDAIDRENLRRLINATGIPADGLFTKGTPYNGTPKEHHVYDPWQRMPPDGSGFALLSPKCPSVMGMLT